MNALVPLIAVVALFVIAYAGSAAGLGFVFGVLIPYLALAAFVVGVIYRVVKWGRVPVPFRIPTTCGQQKSLDWIKHSKYDNPATTGQVVVRMLAEVFLFRSLFRNTKTELADVNGKRRLVYGSEKILWLAGLAFHWTFLIVLIRHLRFFTEPVPKLIVYVDQVDSFFQLFLPSMYLTGAIFLLAVTVLFLRRVFLPQIRYISLAQDYFPLYLILGVALTGFWMRYVNHTDIEAVKQLTMGLAGFSPTVPEGISPVFFAHLLFVSVLFGYFPWSKLMHMAGVFMSPTRNLANNNRVVRHINPWNPEVKFHTYEEYEDEFRDKMVKAGIPVDKPLAEEE